MFKIGAQSAEVLYGQKNHNKLNQEISRSTRNLSTGKRVQYAADSPTDLGIIKNFEAHLRGTSVAIENAQDIMLFLRSGMTGMNRISELMGRMRDLAVRAANEAPLNGSDRDTLNQEYLQLYEQISNTAIRTSSAYAPENTPICWEVPSYRDVVYVVDYSGSMGGEIAYLQTALNGFMDQMTAAGVDWNIGVVSYSDEGIGEPTVHNDLTGDRATAQANVNAIATAWGGDWRESGLEGIDQAINSSSWRYAPGDPYYERHIILTTDAPWHDDAGGYPGDGLSALDTQNVIDDAVAQGINVHIAGRTGDASHIDMADGTGGILGDVNNIGVVFDGIMATISQGGVAPEPDRTLSAQINTESSHNLEFLYEDVRTVGLDFDAGSISTVGSARTVIDNIDTAIDKLSDYQQKYGAYYNRLSDIVDQLSESYIADSQSASSLRDTNMEQELTDLTRSQILSMSNIQGMLRANHDPAVILDLLAQAGIG